MLRTMHSPVPTIVPVPLLIYSSRHLKFIIIPVGSVKLVGVGSRLELFVYGGFDSIQDTKKLLRNYTNTSVTSLTARNNKTMVQKSTELFVQGNFNELIRFLRIGGFLCRRYGLHI